MGWMRRAWNVLRPERLSSDLDRELSAHVAECADELIAGGMPGPDAYREARRRFGDSTRQKERTRDADVLGWLESIAADIRYACRSLSSAPVFAIVAILSLALGIGANTAIFSLINAVMLRPLPVSAPEELVHVTMGGDGISYFTNPIWEELHDRQDIFSGAFAHARTEFNLAGGGEVRYANGYWVTGGFFSTLGLRPVVGRLLNTSDDVRGCSPVGVVSAAFWEREFGGRRALDNTSVLLDGHRFEVVGVADPDFAGVDVGWRADIYAPLCAKTLVDGPRALDSRTSWYLRIMGRPRPGVTTAQVSTHLTALSPSVFAATIPAEFDAQRQREYASNRLDVSPAEHGVSALRGQYSAALKVLLGVVGVVLLIACANVANLVLVRATARRQELAVRLAIGAGRMRIVRQLFTESLVLASLGAVLGVLFASWGSRVLVRLLEGQGGAVWLDLTLDGRVLAFTSAIAVLCGLFFGLAPAWHTARVPPQAAMKSGGRGIADGHSRFTFGKALVVGQVALSFALIVAAGLLLNTFRNVLRVDPGFAAEGVLLVRVDLQGTELEGEGRAIAKQSILERLRALPNVRSASASHLTPISGSGWNGLVMVDGYSPQGPRDALVFFNAVTDGFLETLGTRLVAGRDIQPSDTYGAPRVALINEALASKFFGSASPVGRELTEEMFDQPDRSHLVIGVVENAKYGSLREEPVPTVYLPMAQNGWDSRSVTFAVRPDGDPSALGKVVAREVTAVNPAISLESIPFSNQVALSMSRERLLASLAGFFGALAIAMSVIGLYGTMSYAVVRRRNEIGVRMALGASGTGVVRMILREAMWLITIGLAAGLAIAAVGTRWLEAFLFGVTPTDPNTIALAALSLAGVALGSAALPAWRAARLDPVTALRTD